MLRVKWGEDTLSSHNPTVSFTPAIHFGIAWQGHAGVQKTYDASICLSQVGIPGKAIDYAGVPTDRSRCPFVELHPSGGLGMKVEGACHCGAVTYMAEVEPGTSTVCHCNDCQVQSGSVFRTNIQAPAATFQLTKGNPRTYLKTAASGNQRVLAFCEICGSSLYACSAQNPETYSLRVGTLKQRHELGTPAREIWTSRRHDWVELPGIDAEFAGQP